MSSFPDDVTTPGADPAVPDTTPDAAAEETPAGPIVRASGLRTRRPTGRTPWPIVLVEGAEKSGKTWESLTLSGDPRIDETWALDLGEDSLDEYRDIPGARFEVLVHDGTWRDIIGQLEAAVAESEVLEAQGKVALLIVDSATFEWEMLRAWTMDRAKRTRSNRKILTADADAEIKASRNLWNDADDRHRNFLGLCRRFRGPVILTARGKVISATAENGQPVPAVNGVQPKDYRVEAKQGLGFDVHAWVRFSRESGPQVIGLRHVKYGIRPGIDQPRELREFSLSWLIFDLMGCAPGEVRQRSTIELNADQVMPGEEVEPVVDDEPRGRQQQGGHWGSQRDRQRAQPQREEPAAAAPSAEEVAQRIKGGVDWLFAAENVDEAAKRHAYAQTSDIAQADVSGLVPPILREPLEVRDGVLTFTELAELVVVSVGRRKESVKQTLAAAALARVEKMRADNDAAGVVYDRHTGEAVSRELVEQAVRDDKRMMREIAEAAG